jgi:hypothetical protein
MSDDYLVFIPNKPDYVPPEPAQDRAYKKLKEIFGHDIEIEYETYSEVQFVSCFENFERIFCPVCNKKISIEDWQEQMDSAYESKFKDLKFITPCCNAESSLNDLVYDWPQGFALFEIRVMNPADDISDKNLQFLSDILGCDIRKIWQHI